MLCGKTVVRLEEGAPLNKVVILTVIILATAQILSVTNSQGYTLLHMLLSESEQIDKPVDAEGGGYKVILCRCGVELEMPAGDMKFHASKGFSDPSHCKPCRDNKKKNAKFVVVDEGQFLQEKKVESGEVGGFKGPFSLHFGL
jgi:hypothetical protein